MALPTILVPLDLGREADRALPVGRALADRTGGRLEVVVITDTAEAAAAASDQREVRAHARRAGVGVDAIRLRTGGEDVVAALADEAVGTGATLCIATHAWGHLADLVAHGIAGRLVLRDGPMVLVGPHARRDGEGPREVLACVDGRSGSPAVPSVARTWAEWLGTKVRVLQVEEGHDCAGGARPAAVAAGAIHAEGVPAGWDVVAARSAEAGILAAAAEMDDPLIVVGSRSAPPEGLVPGTLHHVIRAVVAASADPVLVAPA
ncbi:MAG TPA: universal stress protein [Acidimicrobiales bacterium]|nr:universal stress protein [Acidimicrobiales bacterium]